MGVKVIFFINIVDSYKNHQYNQKESFSFKSQDNFQNINEKNKSYENDFFNRKLKFFFSNKRKKLYGTQNNEL